MIKGAEKRGKVHTTPIAAREREGELRQAQGSLAGERGNGRRGRKGAAVVILIRLSVRTVHPIRPRERECESSSSLMW